MKGILGRKVGMTQVFTTDGKLIPVTVVEVEENIVTQIKTVEKDGYNAIQLGAFNKREKVSNSPEKGHVKKANTQPKRFLKEIRGIEVENYTLGQVIAMDTFEIGETIDVTGTSKGKGFQGVIKRWNQSRGPMSHGSTYHRRVGSLGPMRPMRVLKGKKLPGHMGNEQVTIQNLQIISIDKENNCILVSGNIPGPKNSLVFIRTSIKNPNKKENIELIDYSVIEDLPKVEETIVKNVEESKEEVVETPTEEIVEESVENQESLEEKSTGTQEEKEEVQEEVIETPVEEEKSTEVQESPEETKEAE